MIKAPILFMFALQKENFIILLYILEVFEARIIIAYLKVALVLVA